MTKRGIHQFKAGVEKIRISIPGVDVDSANISQCLLHEQALYSQPYFTTFVACPFAGNTSTGLLSQTVDVAVPDVTSTPVVIILPVDSDSTISFPAQKAYGTGSDAAGYNVNNFALYSQVVSSTLVQVGFVKPATSRRSPSGAYLILMRKPDPT